MPRKDITPTLLRKLYLKKLLSKKEIALLLKCNIITIHKKMKKFGIPARTPAEAVRIAMKKKIIEIPKSKLENLYLKRRLSIPEIAKKLNHDSSIIARELKKHNILRRSHAIAVSLGWRKKRVKRAVIKKLYYQGRLTQKEIAEKLHKSRGYICGLMKEYNLKTRTADKYHSHYQKYDFSNNLDEKAYLIGFRLGDLSACLFPSKKLIRVDCTSTKSVQIKLFKNLFQNYGYVWIGKPRKDGNRVCVVHLNHTFDFLLPKKDNIPKWIRENKGYFLSFLAGYIDAEGCIYIAKNNVAGLKLSSYDKKILKQIHQQLLKIGIECNPPQIHIKKGYKKSDGYIYQNDEWNFVVTKKSSLLPLLQLLKQRLKHQKRLKDLKKAEQNIIKRNQRNLPENASLKYLAV
jgi:hypothetical protein